MYKGEALVALDKIADGIDELNPESVTDVSTTLPEANIEQGLTINQSKTVLLDTCII